MKCLVLGAGGFIGRHLLAELVRNELPVNVFGRDVAQLAGTGIDSFFEGDFGEVHLLRRALKGVDTVFHLIGSTSPATAENDQMFDISTNLLGTINLLTLCLEEGVKRVIFASSGGTVYGATSASPIRETEIPKPISAYGITKLSIENYIYLYNHIYGMKNVVLRIANPFGPLQQGKKSQGVIGTFMRAAKRGDKVTVFGANAVRDYIYVEDVASAFMKAAEYQGDEHLFNVGTGVGRSLADLIENIEQLTGLTLAKDIKAARPFDVATNILDTVSAKRLLGWEPLHPWDQSLEKTWDWIRSS